MISESFIYLESTSISFPVICQMNVEFHYTPAEYPYDLGRFFKNLNTLLNGGYAFVRSNYFETSHRHSYHRAYFINYNNKMCIEKFLCVRS
jgi:hypothetical protein